MNQIESYHLQPGFIFVSEKPYLIHTVLGSCVAVCVWDETLKLGGMNHFILNRSSEGQKNARYGDTATLYLLKLIFDLGAKKENVKAHIVGGGQNPELNSTVGADNIEIAEKILLKNEITVATKDIGGFSGRKVVFNNTSGEILVYKSTNIRRSDWY